MSMFVYKGGGGSNMSKILSTWFVFTQSHILIKMNFNPSIREVTDPAPMMFLNEMRNCLSEIDFTSLCFL